MTKPTLSYPYLKGYLSTGAEKRRPDLRARYAASLMAQTGLWVFNTKSPTTEVIPESSEELLELLNDDQRRDAIFADAERTKEFLAAYSKAVNKANPDLSKQIANDAAATIMEMLKDDGVNGRVPQEVLDHQVKVEDLIQSLIDGQPVRTIKPSAQRNAAYNRHAPGAPLDKVVNDLGVFAKLINPKIPLRSDDEREMFSKITEVQNAYSSNDPSSSGFLIPEAMRSEIVQLALEQSVVRSRSTVITMTTSSQKIPYVDAQSHADSVFGGMVFFWTEESGEIITTKAKFGRMELQAKKLTGGARVPNELWNDASALSTWLTAALPAGLAYFEDLAFLTGSGVGEPLGFYNSPAVIAVTRDTSNEIHPIDIFTMFSRMLPQSMARGVWVANQTTLPQLLDLKVTIQEAGANVGGSWVGLVQGGTVAGAPVLSILGRPLLISEKNPALGSAGDLSFVDFSHYLIGDRQAISMDTSEHSRFMHDERELRVIERVDGRPWLPAAITPKNGDPLSPVVKLDA